MMMNASETHPKFCHLHAANEFSASTPFGTSQAWGRRRFVRGFRP